MRRQQAKSTLSCNLFKFSTILQFSDKILNLFASFGTCFFVKFLWRMLYQERELVG